MVFSELVLFPTAGFSHRVYCGGFNEAKGDTGFLSFVLSMLAATPSMVCRFVHSLWYHSCMITCIRSTVYGSMDNDDRSETRDHDGGSHSIKPFIPLRKRKKEAVTVPSPPPSFRDKEKKRKEKANETATAERTIFGRKKFQRIFTSFPPSHHFFSHCETFLVFCRFFSRFFHHSGLLR